MSQPRKILVLALAWFLGSIVLMMLIAECARFERRVASSELAPPLAQSRPSTLLLQGSGLAGLALLGWARGAR